MDGNVEVKSTINVDAGALAILREAIDAAAEAQEAVENIDISISNALADRDIFTSGLAIGGGNLSADRTISVPETSQADAEAGTNNNGAMSARRTRQAFDAFVALGTLQPGDPTLTALAALVTAADKLIYATGSDAFATTDLTSFARTILDDTNAAGVRTTISAQQSDATLTALAALVTAADKMIYATGVDTFALADLTSFARTILDDVDAAAV